MLTKTSTSAPVPAGGSLTYTLTAKNNGPADGTGVTITDTLPAAFSFTSAATTQGSCSRAGSTVTCNLGNLASGATATVTLVVTPVAVGTFSNTATISGNETDANPVNDTATVANTVKAPSLNFPILRSTSDLSTGLALVNLGTGPAPVTLRAYAASGDPIQGTGVNNPVNVTVARSQQIAKLASEFFNLRAPNEGWVEVQTDSPGVVGFELLFNAEVLDGGATASGSSSPVILTDIEYDSTYTTEVHVENHSGAQNSVKLELRADSGAILASFATLIGPKGKFSGRIQDIFRSLPLETYGYLVVSGTQELSAAEVLIAQPATAAKPSAIALLPGQRLTDGSSSPSTLYSAHFVTGSLYTVIDLVNATSRPASLVVRALGENGSNLATPAAITLKPGEHGQWGVRSLFNFSRDAAVTGSLVIESNISGIVGDVSFGDAAESFLASLPLDSEPSKFAAFAHIANAAGFYTGLAAMNTGKQAANVDVRVFRPDGIQVGAARLPVAANARVSKLLPEIVSASTGQTSGYFTVESDQPLSMLALFGTSSGNALAAIPAQRPMR